MAAVGADGEATSLLALRVRDGDASPLLVLRVPLDDGCGADAVVVGAGLVRTLVGLACVGVLSTDASRSRVNTA